MVEAGKSAEANVIRRREETATTRSLLNTAKVMEDNPVALRLKELETLERVAERIDKISVFGIGDHIQLRRSERKLPQRDVANQIGVSSVTIGNWEKNSTDPPVEFMPAIMAFLGYDPMPAPTTLAERMRAYRHRFGLSIKAAAPRWGARGLLGRVGADGTDPVEAVPDAARRVPGS